MDDERDKPYCSNEIHVTSKGGKTSQLGCLKQLINTNDIRSLLYGGSLPLKGYFLHELQRALKFYFSITNAPVKWGGGLFSKYFVNFISYLFFNLNINIAYIWTSSIHQH